MDLCLEMDDEPAQSLWVRITRHANVNDVVGVCYRPPDQEEVDEASFRQLERFSHLQAMLFSLET